MEVSTAAHGRTENRGCDQGGEIEKQKESVLMQRLSNMSNMSNIHGEHTMHSSEMETYTVKSTHWEMQMCTLLMSHKCAPSDCESWNTGTQNGTWKGNKPQEITNK